MDKIIPVIDYMGHETGRITVKEAFERIIAFIESEGCGQPAPTGSHEEIIAYLNAIEALIDNS